MHRDFGYHVANFILGVLAISTWALTCDAEATVTIAAGDVRGRHLERGPVPHDRDPCDDGVSASAPFRCCPGHCVGRRGPGNSRDACNDPDAGVGCPLRLLSCLVRDPAQTPPSSRRRRRCRWRCRCHRLRCCAAAAVCAAARPSSAPRPVPPASARAHLPRAAAPRPGHAPLPRHVSWLPGDRRRRSQAAAAAAPDEGGAGGITRC